jgi:hypothetical protein
MQQQYQTANKQYTQPTQQQSNQNLEGLLYENARAIVQEAESGGMDGPTRLNNWFDQNASEMISNFGFSKYAQLREQILKQMFPQPQGINLFR